MGTSFGWAVRFRVKELKENKGERSTAFLYLGAVALIRKTPLSTNGLH